VHDRVFRNALIYDGSGAPLFLGELALDGDRIAGLGPAGTIAAGAGSFEHDLYGRALAPGFIDAHTHYDRIVLDAPAMLPKISQGVTSVVVGNCGISLAPAMFACDPPPPMNLLGGREAYTFPRFAAYADAVARAAPSLNLAALVGHSALRLATMKDIASKASEGEMDAMLAHADEAMAHGAIGFSTGLFYSTNAGADADEVAQIAAPFAEHGGVCATNMRNESGRVLDSMDETLMTSKQAQIPLIVSHHKCAGPRNWGRTLETLPKLEAAAAGQPVNLDVYPYAAGSTNLRAHFVTDEYRIMIAWSRPYPEMTGRDLGAIAADWQVDIHQAARRLDPAGAIYFQMDEADVRRVMCSPLAMIGSDGLPHDDHPHPRLWGTFPRVIGRYARDLGLFSIELAIHKMTGLPEKVFRLPERGRLLPGYFDGLTVFDLRTVIDRATYDTPLLRSDRIEMVFVNGVLSFVGGAETDMPGRAGRLIGGRVGAR